MDKNKLWRLIQAKEKQHQKNKVKRSVYTILFFTVVFLGLSFSQGRDGFDALDFIGEIIVYMILAGITFAANAVIFGQLYNVSANEEKELKDLKKLLDELEKK